MTTSFSLTLLSWHVTIDRELPWKESKDPYHIWLSEIILQQTRVEQGIPYFLKFRDRYVNVASLAESTDEELMKHWEGLGYYSRARNLHKAAKKIVSEGGEFPKNYKGLLALPGVGPYTAAAIASFAYDLPHPVIDGNVNRVISRIFGITEGIDTREGRKAIEQTVESIFDQENPAEFNQAIMDFGALHCTPRNPKCNDCPFSSDCYAFAHEMVSELPFKSKRVKKQHKRMDYAVLFYEDSLVIKKRLEKGIWRHLHDFIEVENSLEGVSATLAYIKYEHIRSDGPYKHVLTHRNLEIYFHIIEAQELKIGKGSPYFLVERKNLRKFAFPKIIDWYLEDKSIS